MTVSKDQFIQTLSESGLKTPEEVTRCLEGLPDAALADGKDVAQALTAAGELTIYQVAAIEEGKVKDLIIGNYEVLEKLGAGGMGTVYKARHRRMKRLVALKVLANMGDQNKVAVQRFQREVEVIAQLSHPNIVIAHDADQSEIGHFLVMEYVEGRDLGQEVKARGRLPVAEALDAILQSARALEYAHGKGVVHRDIKPSNLLRDAAGVVKVADLGLARFRDALVGPHDDTSVLTQSGSVLGTIDFMPPEQAMNAHAVDPRGDIYSLGCTLYYLLAGGPPYRGGSMMETLLKHRDAPIPSLAEVCPEVPPEVEAVFRKMAAKGLDERYQSMTEVIRALEACREVVGPATVMTSAPPPPPPVPSPAPAPVAAPAPARAPMPARLPPVRPPSRVFGPLLLSVLVLAVAGAAVWYFYLRVPAAGLVGSWTYKGEATEILLVFDSDGKYSLFGGSMEAVGSDGFSQESGKYSLLGDTLTLRGPGGVEHQFTVKLSGGRLELSPASSGGKNAPAVTRVFTKLGSSGGPGTPPAGDLFVP